MLKSPQFKEEVLALFAERGAEAVDIPVIQPADPFLDMAGEDLRRRIFLTESETGKSLCLRPEFTIPVCLRHIELQPGTPRRYAYHGQVFRQRRDGGNEFYQAGIEDLGNMDMAAADAAAVKDAADTLAALLPGAQLITTLGDQTVFEAVVESLGLPDGWQTRLIRAFGDAGQLDALLGSLSKPSAPLPGLDGEVAALLSAGDEDGLAALLDKRMRASGLMSNASRTPAEIAARVFEKARLSSVHLDAKALDVLKTFLALDTPLADAPDALAAFARIAGLDIAAALTAFDDRVSALKKSGFSLDQSHYRAAFGRPLDYYTGLVFEHSTNGAVLAGGGRFDRLLTLLGAQTTIPAVGFSLWLDRIEAAQGGRSI
ncbi:ATP phosphoribosyltransferase regulatory subunit [Hoeflea prorocentri]|uniref:ATP phosphoribosyltransferase regulatory subunit n=2 Tax=Hoeflea prorocentri TaxID=1922333 RepID=A0A9X3ZIZ9_9HYPH|nr:ATP phosphoribosyltransferase regulatory subunit [Hoeflea prorocentri]MCY6382275.1 ATP phosphoribosyltransferase regulatory subunit [Hoeflea prorocentri]MDA5400075.1 ATP phosphoribosyltransferase regulatory subunit [Hoeflea prorocentri]